MDVKTLQKARAEIAKNMKFLPEKQLRQNLEFAADDMVEAYQIGAEEAQAELVQRITDLIRKAEAKS